MNPGLCDSIDIWLICCIFSVFLSFGAAVVKQIFTVSVHLFQELLLLDES